MSTREEVLTRAYRMVTDTKAAEHGDIRDTFKRIAAFWSAYIGITIAPSEVAVMLSLMKAARQAANPDNLDNYVDEAGYIAIACELYRGEQYETDE